MICQQAGRPCRRNAETLYRIKDVGDRWLCADDFAVLSRMGYDVVQAPAWLQRSLAKDMSVRGAA